MHTHMKLQHGAARGAWQKLTQQRSKCFACFGDMFSTLLCHVNNISYFQTVHEDSR